MNIKNMRKRNVLIRCLCLLVMSTMILINGMTERVSAQETVLSDYGYEIKSESLLPFDFDETKLVLPEGWTGREDIRHKILPESEGVAYEFDYPGSLDYFGEALSVKITVTYLGRNGYYEGLKKAYPKHDGGGIYLEDRHICLETFGTDYEIKISFRDDEGKDFPFTGATLFNDPDESNYLGFTSKEIYYINKGVQSNWTSIYGTDPGKDFLLADNYLYDPDRGLIRLDSEYDHIRSFEGVDYNVNWVAFDNGSFGVLIDDSSSFTYTVSGKDDYISMPDFYIIYIPYSVEYYYMQDDGTYRNVPDLPCDTDDENSYPYRRYARILNDSDGDRIMEVSDPLPYVSINEDDKTADARMRTADPNGRIRNYELDKDKNAAWQLRLKEDGTTVLKVYFEQTYRVTFHDNGKIYDWTAGEAFSDQTRSDYRYNEMTDDFDDYNVTPLKENYSFIGWSKKEEKTTEVLSSRDIASIPVRENADYWAQWKNTGTSSPARPSTDQRNPVPDTSVS